MIDEGWTRRSKQRYMSGLVCSPGPPTAVHAQRTAFRVLGDDRRLNSSLLLLGCQPQPNHMLKPSRDQRRGGRDGVFDFSRCLQWGRVAAARPSRFTILIDTAEVQGLALTWLSSNPCSTSVTSWGVWDIVLPTPPSRSLRLADGLHSSPTVAQQPIWAPLWTTGAWLALQQPPVSLFVSEFGPHECS